MRQKIECWDMDDTIVDTMAWLYGPVSSRIAEVCGLPVEVVATARDRVPVRTINFFKDWFTELGIASAEWAALEADLRTGIAARADSCLYPGMRELLEARLAAGVRMVLVTAGDRGYQSWKFSLLGLEHIFPEADRHYVPMRGSKAEVIIKYQAFGHVTFIDDSPKWHRDLYDLEAEVASIRTRWPGSMFEARHLDDDELWDTVTTIAELQRRLER